MELLTDILAIFGWGLFGFCLAMFSPHKLRGTAHFAIGISFGLIAASLVLG